ncbi:TerC family protein [Selenomonas sp.]|uniref:TerC family protein n=1 Tax=Selenomonas sp. TaxID=2053611 RepID=UPI0025EB3622|nr:TerC family protein [Selenomonas sp.]MCI6086365.1 TerC family protein [Selenomonas sp.]MDY3298330.1 TerC family protein [Selenomonas sp.]MDY4414874.1 TerC family protein [Selenomonas sp.]
MEFFLALGTIVVMDLALAGDNAVVIAMAANALPEAARKKAVLIGTGGAVAVRIALMFVAVELLQVPCLQALGGLILLPIAAKLLDPSHKKGGGPVAEAQTLGGAVKTILVADVAMSLDNVLSIAGAAQGHFLLAAAGILISIPIVVAGSSLLGKVMDRFPVLMYAGAAVIGWTAGKMLLADKAVGAHLADIFAVFGSAGGYVLPAALALLVCVVGHFKARRQASASVA